MSIRAAVCLVGALAACSDERCIEGVCPDPSEARKLPGPCRGASTSLGLLEFAYDGDRLTHAGFHVRDEQDREQFVGSDWTYDAAGSVTQMSQRTPGFPSFPTTRWTFDGTSIRVIGGSIGIKTFEAATFAFLPLVGSDLAVPSAELGLIEDDGQSYAWTTEGSRRIRRSIPTLEHPVLSIVTFDFDDRDRIVSISRDRDGDGTPNQVDAYVYDGDLLVREGRHREDAHPLRHPIDWTYDLGGNVVEGTSESYREVYSYECW